MKLAIKIQFFILLVGTVYVLANFANLLFAFYKSPAPDASLNPFLSLEFFASLFLVSALLLNLISLALAGRQAGKIKKEETEVVGLKSDATGDSSGNLLGSQAETKNKT